MALYSIPTGMDAQPWAQCLDFIPDSKSDNWGDPSKILPEALLYMQKLRDMAQVPIRINAAVATGGHAERSRHYVDLPGQENEGRRFADAFDFSFGVAREASIIGHDGKPTTRWSYVQQYAMIQRLPVGAVGFYPHWMTPGWHIDFRYIATGKLKPHWIRDANGEYHYDMEAFLDALMRMSGIGSKQTLHQHAVIGG